VAGSALGGGSGARGRVGGGTLGLGGGRDISVAWRVVGGGAPAAGGGAGGAPAAGGGGGAL